jgi:integrase
VGPDLLTDISCGLVDNFVRFPQVNFVRDRMRDLKAEAAARGETRRAMEPVSGAIITVGQPHASGRSPRDHHLPPDVAGRLAEAVPPNTRRAWASRWARFERWCAVSGHAEPMPPTATMLAEYLDYLGHDQRLKVSTLESHLGSIMALTHLWVAAESERRAQLRLTGLDEGTDPVAPSTVLARKAISARSRTLALDPSAEPGAKRAAPLLPADVRAMVDAIEQNTLVGFRDRALILLAFSMGRRGAEVAAVNNNDLTEPEEADGEVLRVRVRMSKTNSSGMKEDSVDVPRSQDLRYCPVTAVRRWQLELARRGYTGAALFPRLDNRGRIGAAAGSAARARTVDDGRITQQTFYRVVRKRAAAAGVDVRVKKDGTNMPRQISAHSTRRGFVTAAFATGADPLHVARHAGFTPGSKVLYRYVDESLKVNPAKGLLDAQ